MAKVTVLHILALVFGVSAFASASSQIPTADNQNDKTQPGKKSKPKFTISKETTYILGPVDKDGYIDYAAALNERLSKGVTPENNAAVLIWKALGPRPEGEPMAAQYFRVMGMEPPPEKGEYFVDWYTFIKEQFKVDANLDPSFDLDQRCREKPWTAKKYPQMAAWLKANEKPLNLMVEATKRPRFFFPFINEGKAKAAFGFDLHPRISPSRSLGAALITRAMLSVGEQKHDEAWTDIVACHLLGRQLGHHGTLIEYIFAVFINAIANGAEIVFVDESRLEQRRLQACLRELQGLPKMAEVADAIDFGERFCCLNAMVKEPVGRLIFHGANPPPEFDAESLRSLDLVDRDPMLRQFNRISDQLAKALRIRDRFVREKALDAVMVQLRGAKDGIPTPAERLRLILAAANPAEQAKGLAEDLGWDSGPMQRTLSRAADRVEQTHRNVLLAFALEIYQRENGKYPKELAELASKDLAQVPEDLFSGKALIYRPSENGYLLYSVGFNGIDDGGRGIDDDPPGGDDLAVRMPLPKAKDL